jgi:hypothetical protein
MTHMLYAGLHKAPITSLCLVIENDGISQMVDIYLGYHCLEVMVSEMCAQKNSKLNLKICVTSRRVQGRTKM